MPFWILEVEGKLFPEVFWAFMAAERREGCETAFPQEIRRLILQVEEAQIWLQIEVKIGVKEIS